MHADAGHKDEVSAPPGSCCLAWMRPALPFSSTPSLTQQTTTLWSQIKAPFPPAQNRHPMQWRMQGDPAASALAYRTADDLAYDGGPTLSKPPGLQ